MAGQRCANCGLEIGFSAVIANGKAYCCGGCAQGGPCYCSYDPLELDNLVVSKENRHRSYLRIGRINRLSARP